MLAPTGIAGSIVAASIWASGKFVARRAHRRWKEGGGDFGEVARERAEVEGWGGSLVTDGVEGGPGAAPW